MRGPYVVAAIVTALSLQPLAPRQPPAPRPVARLLVDSEYGASVQFRASAPGGRLRVTTPSARRDTTATASPITAVTPAVVEVFGSPTTLRVSSAPEHPLRVRVERVGPDEAPRAYHGWSFQLERRDDRYVPVAQAFPVPPR